MQAGAVAVPAAVKVVATVDGVNLTIGANVLPATSAKVSEAGSPVPEAVIQNQQSSYEFTVTAVPAGHPDPLDFPELGAAKPGDSPAWAAALGKARDGQGGASHPGPAAHLFGRTVKGIESNPNIPFDGVHLQKTDMIEWVTEAGTRTFIIQISKLASEQVPGFGTGITIDGTGLASPTSIGQTAPSDQQTAQTTAGAHTVPRLTAATTSASVLPTLSEPTWWGGTPCDTVSGHSPGSYQLGSSNVRGIIACGPNNDTYSALGWKDFECTELAGRYMYQAGYITGGYGATGGTIVSNFPNGKLTKVTNGHATSSSPAAGDVISMATQHATGHVALVLGNYVDSTGNGYITLLQQNFSSDGSGRMNVVNGVVQSEETGNDSTQPQYTDGVGWLHDPAGDTPPPPPAPAAPSVSITSPAGGSLVNGTVTITASVSDSTPGATFSTQFYVNAGSGNNAWGAPVAGANPSITWSSSQVPLNTPVTFGAVSTASNAGGKSGNGLAPGVTVTVGLPPTAGATRSTVIAPNGHMYQFVRGSDSTLRMWSADFANGWQDQGTNLGGGTIAGEPSAIIAPNGHVYIFGRGTDSTLRMWSADFANGWQDQGTNLGGVAIATDPAVTIAPNGHMYVFAGGTDGALHMWSADFANGWQDQGTDAYGTVASTPSAAIGANGHMYIFAGGADKALHMWSADFANGWQDQGTNLGGSVGGESEVLAANKNMYVLARGGDGTLRMWSTDFNGWTDSNTNLGGSIASDPSAIIAPNGHMYVFARGTDATLRMWSADFANGWQDQGTNLGGSIASSASEVIANNGSMYIFAGGTDYTLRMWSANFTSGWQDQGTNLSGSIWF
ncbi:CHAP domain-containing protein [Catenulispora sp. GP43]|uniref:CHAP domain-containing protein n=1 Tax=Catenulispora sp. GP43 TaxID=3156263 RepID=UPI003511E899